MGHQGPRRPGIRDPGSGNARDVPRFGSGRPGTWVLTWGFWKNSMQETLGRFLPRFSALVLATLVAPYRARGCEPIGAIPHIARYLFRKFSAPSPPRPKWCDASRWYVGSQARLWDTPFCDISRDNCAIPNQSKHERVLQDCRDKYRAYRDMKSIVAVGPLSLQPGELLKPKECGLLRRNQNGGLTSEGLAQNQSAPKERRRRRAEKRLYKRVFWESPFLLCPLKVCS